MKLWKDLPLEEFTEKWNHQKTIHQAELDTYEEAKKDAAFYADLRDQKTLDHWYRSGSGLGPKVSPAGSFSVAGEGVYAISGIYPRGVYSHLISDKHNGTLASPTILQRVNGATCVRRDSTERFACPHGTTP